MVGILGVVRHSQWQLFRIVAEFIKGSLYVHTLRVANLELVLLLLLGAGDLFEVAIGKRRAYLTKRLNALTYHSVPLLLH